MKSIIAAVVTCMILFGVSAATTHLLFNTAEETDNPELETAQDDSAEESTSDQATEVRAMPVAFPPENAVSVEAVLQMSNSIKKMEQQMIARETQLAKDERRVQLLFDDLATEQDELRAFSEGIDAKVEMANRLSDTLRETLDQLESRKAELQELEKETGSDDESLQEDMDNRVNDVKSWFAGLEAEQAADYLKEFANNGKMAFASSLLQKMPDRQKSKILGAMSDPVLVEQLIDALKVRSKKK
jgi:chromosome segregation ATPase